MTKYQYDAEKRARDTITRSLNYMVLRANAGNPEPLNDYLLSGPQLSPQHLQSLAWLIRQKIGKKGGRKGPRTREDLAIQCATYLALEAGILDIKARDRSARELVAKQAVALIQSAFPTSLKVTVADILGSPTRKGRLSWKPTETVITYVSDCLTDALAAMRAMRSR